MGPAGKVRLRRNLDGDFFQSAPGAFCILDGRGVCVAANAACAALFEVSGSDLRGRALRDLFDPAECAALDAALDGSLASGGSFRLVLRCASASAALRQIELAGTLVVDNEASHCHLVLRDVTDDQARQADARMLRAIASHTDTLLMASGTDRRLTWVNPAFERRSGYSLNEALGTRLGALLQHPDIEAGAVAAMRSALDAERPVRCEVLNRSRSGEAFWVDLEIRPLHDESGNLTGFFSIGRDVTPQRAQAAAMRAAHDRLRATLRALPDLVLELDAAGRCRAAHARGPVLPGVPTASLPGRLLEEALPAALAALCRRAIAEARAADCSEAHEFEYRTGEGAVWIEVAAAQQTVGGADPALGHVLVLRDVTRWAEAQRAARSNANLFKSLFDLSRAGIAMIDLETDTYVDVNDAYTAITGYTRDEVCGRPTGEILPQQVSDPALLDARSRRRLGETLAPVELKRRRKDGTVFDCRWTRIVTQNPDGRSILWSVIEDITEAKRAEAERARLAREADEARAQLEAAIAALGDGFALFDARGRLVTCNARYRSDHPRLAAELLPGLGQERLLARLATDGGFASSVPDTVAWLAARRADWSRPSVAREERLECGRWLKIVEQATPEGGRVILQTDVTALKRAEERLEAIIDAAEAGTWELDVAEGRHTRNARYASMLGYDQKDLEDWGDRAWMDLVHPDDRPRLEQLYADVLEGRHGRFESESRRRHKDGQWVWILGRGRVVKRDAEGRPLHLAGVHLDITRRKALEAALLAERDFLAGVMETTISGIVAFDGAGRCILANAEAERVLGQFPGGMEDRSYDDPGWMVYTLDGRRLSAEEFVCARVARSGLQIRGEKLRVDLSDGTSRTILINSAPVNQPDLPVRVVCTITDITEQHSAEIALREAAEQAEEASRAKSQFLANMSHEIRTPLTGVLGMAELLETHVSDPEARRMVSTIRESGSLLMAVLNDLLDMAKVEAGKLEIEEIPVDLEAIAQKVTRLHRLKASRKGFPLVIRVVASSQRRRLGDPHRILQILNNLVSNAIKFTESGSVEVEIEDRPDGPLRLEVRDTGIGMEAAQVAGVFEAFRQADGATSRRYGGTGLGMSIVKRLVDLMGGEIDVQSTPDAGTSIRVTLALPRAPVAPSAMGAAVPVPADGAPFAGLRALVADDTETNRMILGAMLAALGIAAEIVPDGEVALRAWQPGRFDLVLLDIQMPQMDGIAALEAIRAKAEAAGAPRPQIVAITANTMAHQVADYLDAGFDAHVGKPFGRADLIAVFTRVLAQI